MFARIPLGSARRLLALLLLVGVMLGGSVDAIACEPINEAVAAVHAGTDQAGDHQVPGGDHEGACIHGHCHHGVPHLQDLAALAALPAYLVQHPLPGERRLASITADSPKRPPRA